LLGGQEIVGRDLVGRGVVGLRQDLAEHQMAALFRPVEPVDAIEQLGGYALHHPVHLAMDIGMQHRRSSSTPAAVPIPPRKPIALDQQRAPPCPRGGDPRRQCRPVHRRARRLHIRRRTNLACGFFDGFFGRQIEGSPDGGVCWP